MGVFTQVDPHALVHPLWSAKLAFQHLFAGQRIRVGFGPVTTGEDDLAERKWRIDPIIDEINRKSKRYIASYFVEPEKMAAFDVVVIVKKFNASYFPVISSLKKQGKVFIYDIVDNPNRGPRNSVYFADCHDFARQMDAFILSSPLHEQDTRPFSGISELIEHPIINRQYKHEYEPRGAIRLLAHGYYEGLKMFRMLEPLLGELSRAAKIPVQLIYHSEAVFEDTAHVKYVKWTAENSFRVLADCDIAVTAKDLNHPYQRNKPSTKAIAFLAAGLPVVCTPTEADKRILRENVTAFFAYRPEDWKKHLTELCTSAKLREEMGRAGRASVIGKYSVPRITEKYLDFFDRVLASRYPPESRTSTV